MIGRDGLLFVTDLALAILRHGTNIYEESNNFELLVLCKHGYLPDGF